MSPSISFPVHDRTYILRPVVEADLPAVLEVYRQCEDFLALGPVATASMEMVLKDLEISRDEGGTFFGIFSPTGKMVGIFDFVLKDYLGDPHAAYLSLLMIGAPYRDLGIGRAAVEAFEREVRKDPQVTLIVSGVQVNNPHAVQFWQRRGYRVVSEPRRMPDQTTAVELRKDLV
jgi:ribosomal protein S18 acetylase RimI-like enzyme